MGNKSAEEAFGEAVAQLRRDKGLSQDQLEDAVHRTYLSEIERGLKSPTLGTIIKLSEALGVPASCLVAFAERRGRPNIAAGATPFALPLAFSDALRLLVKPGQSVDELNARHSLADVETLSKASGVDVGDLLARATLLLFREKVGGHARSVRDALTYITNPNRTQKQKMYAKDGSTPWELDAARTLEAVVAANLTIELVHDLAKLNNVPIFELLGLRNLSSFVGEIFAREVQRVEGCRLRSNPNQDGYPDLLALTSDGQKYIKDLESRGKISDKSFWSPFPYGGIEVKATCGNTPPARVLAKRRLGESRLPVLTGFDWKAHHRETNNLLGLYWDFVDGLPTVLAACFRNDLTVDDWGKIIQPKEGGGKTTSVSIMKPAGVKKMGEGWLLLPAAPDMHGPIRRVLGLK